MTVARLSTVKTLSVALLMTIMIIGLYALLLSVPGGPLAYLQRKPQWVVFLVVAVPGSPLMAYWTGVLLFQVFCRSGRAIWTDNGRLLLVRGGIVQKKLEDFAGASILERRRAGVDLSAITLRFRDNSEYSISTLLLAEQPEAILKRLALLIHPK